MRRPGASRHARVGRRPTKKDAAQPQAGHGQQLLPAGQSAAAQDTPHGLLGWFQLAQQVADERQLLVQQHLRCLVPLPVGRAGQGCAAWQGA